MLVPMTQTTENQEILEMLSQIEYMLFYRKDGSDSAQAVPMETIKETHAYVRKALEAWHKGTGLKIRG